MFKKVSMLVSLFLVAALMLTGCSSKASQETKAKYPQRKIEIVVPFGSGSGSDATGRALAPLLEKTLGVPVVVNNVPGSGAIKGLEYANSQPADGYTFLWITPSHILGSVQKLSKADLLKDFVPVSSVVQDSVLITGSPKGRFKTWNELVAWAKDHPGDVKVGGLSPKGIDAISMRMIAQAAGINIKFVPFGGGAEVKSAMLGGHIDISNDDPVNARPLVESGDLLALLVANDKRLSAFPQTPSTVELGLNVIAGPWRGLAAKKGTPDEAIKAMEDAIKKAMETPEWKEFIKQSMLDQRPGYHNAQEFAEIWKKDFEFYSGAFKKLGL